VCVCVLWQLVDREHRLNAALLRSGKFKEAVATLMEWMRKMDETLAEQKLTSTDYKFLKSQLQMQQVSSRSSSHSSSGSFYCNFVLFCTYVLTLVSNRRIIDAV